MSTTERHAGTVPPVHGETDASVTGLVSRLATDISELMRGEMHLARAELKGSVNDAKKGVISLAVGAIVLLTGLPILLASIAFAISGLTGIPLWVSFLIVGLIVSIVGAVMLKGASSKLSADNLAPSRTAASLGKDGELIKEQTR